MNNTFDTRRFGKYFMFDLKNAKSNYGLTFLIVICMPIIIYILSIIFSMLFNGHWTSPSLPMRVGFSCIACAIICMSFPAQAYGKITDKRAGSEWLMIPASKLEKYLSMILITGIIVPICFVLGYGIVDFMISLIDPTYVGSLFGIDVNKWFAENDVPISFAGRGYWLMFFSISPYMLTFLLGALCFRTKKVSKTIVALIIISIGLMIASVSCHFSIDSDFVDRHAKDLNFTINAMMDIPLIIEYLVLLVGIWFRISTIKH